MFSQTAGRSVAKNAAIVAGAFAVSRVLGLLREIVIAARFGTGDTYDAYIVAFRIPDLLFVIVMSGAFGSAFIPVFGGFLARDDKERAWRLANALLTYTVVILLVVAQFILFFAEPLIGRLIAPELSAESQHLAVDLTRLLLLSPLLLGLGAAAKGMLEAQDLFALPAVAPIVYNLGIILGAAFLTPFMDIYGVAVGVILGAAGHVSIQFGYLLRHGLSLRPTFDLKTDGLREVARLMGPRLAGQFLGQSNLIVITNFTSRAGEGAISALSYGEHLVMLPHGILALSMSTVIFPRMARQFELGRMDELRQTLLSAIGPLTFLTLPSVVVLFTLRESIVQVVLQYGSFTSESSDLVVESIAFLSLGLLARAIIEPLTRGFYAMHDTSTPLFVSLASVVVNAALAWLLVDRFGLAGVALSLSIAYTLRMSALLVLLSRRTGGLLQDWVMSITRVLPAAVILGVLGVATSGPLTQLTDPVEGRSVWGYLAFGLVVTLLGIAYLLAATLTRVPEATDLFMRVRQRVRRWK
jgi:putative peptidoglycan lipid II flippase